MKPSNAPSITESTFPTSKLGLWSFTILYGGKVLTVDDNNILEKDVNPVEEISYASIPLEIANRKLFKMQK